jgi:hypothetical protein
VTWAQRFWRWWTRRRAAVALTGFAAGAGAVISYNALAAQGRASREPDALSWLFPIGIDGMLGVATLALFEVRTRGARAQVWALLVIAIVVSVAGNAAHAGALGWATAWSAVPALAYAGALHLLVLMHREPARVRPAGRTASTEAGKRRAKGARRRSVAGQRVELPDGRRVSPGHARKVLPILEGASNGR